MRGKRLAPTLILHSALFALCLLLLGHGAALAGIVETIFARMREDQARAGMVVTGRPVGQSSTAVWVAADKDDYAPGATASITGSGFWANEVVTLHVVHTDTTPPGGAGHNPWTVTADASGSIATSWYVNPDDSAGSAFNLTAVGRSSGLAAQATFTDAAVLTITLGSQETFWLDDNKCNAQGPRAAWLSFIIKNTGTTAATNVTVTFAGFTGTNASFFSAPSDLTRTFSTIAAGAQEPVYFYVDYSEVCNHNKGGGSPYAGYTANYTLTVTATGVGPVVRNGTVTTNDLLTAAAAGVAASTTLGPGFFVGQLLTQTVTYAFGNNSDLFFQPAGDAGFDAACIRLVGSEITNVSGTVSPSLIGLKDQLWFPTASVPAGGGNIFLTYTWQIQCVNRLQSLHPWAAAKSGQKYKYEGFQSSTIFPASQAALTATKSVSPASLTDNTGGPVTWTVTFSNPSTVPIVLSKVTDVLPACMSINDPAASGSQVTAANSSSIPSVGATGTVNWVGINLGDSPSSTYQVPASGTLTLKYKTNVSSCSFPASYTNSATGLTGTTAVGPVHATLTIGAVPAIALTKSAFPLTYGTVGQTITYTYTIQNTGTATLPGPFSVTDTKLGAISPCGTGPLAPNASTSCMVAYAVTQADLNAGSIVNTATASTTYNSQPVTSAPSSATVMALPPVVTASKAVALVIDTSPGGPSPGDTLQYTVTIANTGGAAATGVVLTDFPDPNTTLVPGSVTTTQGTITSGNLGTPPVTVSVGTIPGGTTATVTFQVTVNSPLAAGVTQIANQGTVSGTNFPTVVSDDPGTLAANDPTLTTVVAAPVLTASKTETLFTDTSPSGPSPGDTLQYTVKITNSGNAAATGVSFSDTPDGNTTLVSGSVTTSQGSITSGNAGTPPVTVNVGTIAAGATVTISFRVTVANPLPSGVTQVANQGTVTSNQVPAVLTDDPSTAASIDATITPVTAAPLIAATKVALLQVDADGNGVPSPGDTLLYQSTITNSGNVAGTATLLDDVIDPNTALVVGSVQTSQGTIVLGNTAGDTSVRVDLGPIAGGGGSATVSFEVTIANPLAVGVTAVANQAQVSGSNFPTVLSDDPSTPAAQDPTITAVAAAPVVRASKTETLFTDADSNGMPSPGDTLLYQITLTNSGNVTATGVSFSDTPDSNTTLVAGSVQTSQGTITGGNTGTPPVTVNVGTISAGGAVTISFRVTINNPLPAGVTQVTNQGTVSGANFASVPTDDPGTAALNDPTATTVVAAPVVRASKTETLFTDADHDGVPSPGDTLLYQVTLVNTGNVAATGISFTDTPDSNTTLVVGSVQTGSGTVTSGNTAGNTTVGVSVGTLAADPLAGTTISFLVTINLSLPAGVTTVSNQGLVTGTNVPAEPTDDPSTAAVNDPTMTAVTAAPLVTARKSAVLLTDADSNGFPSPGDTLLYEIRVHNTGNAAATGVSFSDIPDSNTTLVVGSVLTDAGVVTSGNTGGDTSVGVNIGTLAADPIAVTTISFKVTIKSPLPAGVTAVSNQGVVMGTNVPGVLTDDPNTVALNDPTVTAVTAAPLVVARKTAVLLTDADGNGVPSPGDTLLYEIRVRNTGNVDATSVSFSDTPDPNTTLVVGSVLTDLGAVSSGNSPGDQSVGVTIGTLPADPVAVATISFAVTVNSPLPAGVSTVSNQGVVTGTNIPAVLTDNPDTVTLNDPTVTAVTAAPLVTALKTAVLLNDADGNGVPSPGDTLLYQIRVRNTGNVAATGVSFNDMPDTNTTLVVGSVQTDVGTVISGNTAGDTSVGVVIAVLAADPNVVTTISFAVTINSPLPAGVTAVSNQGVVTGTNVPAVLTDDPDTVTINDPTVTVVTAVPLVTARKTAVLLTDADGNGVPSPGDTLLYQIRVRNTGNVAATGVSFSDTPDSNTTLVVGSVQTDMGTVTSGNTVGDASVGVSIGTLAADPNVVTTISFAVTVNSPLPLGVTTVSNHGLVMGTNVPAVFTDDPDTVAINDPTVTAVTAAPLMTAQKTAVLFTDADGNGVPSPGDTLLYQILVRNTGNAAGTAVFTNDVIDPSTTLVIGSVVASQGLVVQGNTSGDTGVEVSLGSVAGSGGTATISFAVTVNSPLPVGVTQVANQGVVTGSNFPAVLTDDPSTVTINDPTVTAVTAAPLVAARKSAVLVTDADGNGVPSPGDTLLYQIRVQNTGNVAATGVSFSDVPDSNTMLVVGSVQTSLGTVTSGNMPGNTSVGVNIGTLPADLNAVTTISFEVQINSPLPAGVTTVSNQGQVAGTNFSTVLTDNPDTVAIDDPTTTAVTAAPLVTARKTSVLLTDADGNGLPSPGDTLLYQIRVRNTGNVAATGVSFSDTPDSNTTLVVGSVQTDLGTVTSGNTAGDTSVGVNIGTLAADPNAVATISFEVQIKSPLPAGVTTVSNQGVVTGTNFSAVVTDDPNTVASNDPTGTDVPTADLTLQKTGPSSTSVGTTIDYTITLTNLGPDPAAEVVLSDPTPAGLTFFSAGTPCGGGFPCSLGTLQKNASLTLHVILLIPPNYTGPSPIINTALVSAAEFDPNHGNNASAAATNVIPKPPAPVPTLPAWALLVGVAALAGGLGILARRQARSARR